MRNQLSVLIAVILFFSCEETPVFDSEITDGIPLVGIPEHNCSTEGICNSSTVTAQWEGNDFTIAYSYRLEMSEDDTNNYPFTVDVYSSWSEWSTENSVTLEHLDEGIYDLFVKGRFNEDLVQLDSSLLSFEVNAIPESSLRIYPLRQSVTSQEQFDIYIYAEEISNVVGMEIQLSYDSDYISFTDNPMLDADYALGSIITDYSDYTIFPAPESNEDAILISGVMAGNGLSGTGAIMKLTLTYSGSGSTSTTIEIDMANTLLRDINNHNITIENFVPGLIEVGE